MESNVELKEAAQVAQFRFAVIAPVIQGFYSDASQTAYFKRLAEKEMKLPDGTCIKYSHKTFESWLRQYRIRGLEGLMPKERADKGRSRALPDEAKAEIFNLKEKFPRMNATQVYIKLVEDGFIPAKTSVDSVQRFIKKNDLKSARDPNVRDRKAFEEDAFGKMWQADTCYLCHITENGISRQVYCIAIIDDHSRMLVGAKLFYNDNALNFQKVLKDAILAYGIPSKLMVDNGGPYSNEQLSMICVSLGISLIHTRVRDGASKGKSERQWLTMQTTWLYTLDTDSIHSLSKFDMMLQDYVRDYNTRIHSGIKAAPVDRFIATKDHIRKPLSREWVDERFYNRTTRRVRKDSTVSIDNVSYDVPMQFIGMKVEVRYMPDDADSMYILYDERKYPVVKTDRVANCHTKRDNGPALDYSRLGGEDTCQV